MVSRFRIDIEANPGKAVKALAEVDRRLRKLEGEAVKASLGIRKITEQRSDMTARSIKRIERNVIQLKTRSGELRQIFTGLFAGFGLFQGIRGATRLVADFEQTMAEIQAVTNATAQQMEQFSSTARELGRTTRFSATQAGNALVILSRAGFTVAESTDAVAGTLRLAQSAGLDLATAADITAGALRGFRLASNETDKVVDVLALASSRANTNVAELGEGLKFVAPIAAGLKVSIQTTTAALSVLSDNALKGSLAGTGLRRVLAELESPGKKLRSALALAGKSTDDIRVSTVGLTAALQTLRDAGVDTGDAIEIFGQRGGPAFEVLANNIGRVGELTGVLEKARGTAERMAQTMDNTLTGAALRAKSAIQELVIELDKSAGSGDLLTFTLNKIAEGANAVAEARGKGIREAREEEDKNLNLLGRRIKALRDRVRELRAESRQTVETVQERLVVRGVAIRGRREQRIRTKRRTPTADDLREANELEAQIERLIQQEQKRQEEARKAAEAAKKAAADKIIAQEKELEIQRQRQAEAAALDPLQRELEQLDIKNEKRGREREIDLELLKIKKQNVQIEFDTFLLVERTVDARIKNRNLSKQEREEASKNKKETADRARAQERLNDQLEKEREKSRALAQFRDESKIFQQAIVELVDRELELTDKNIEKQIELLKLRGMNAEAAGKTKQEVSETQKAGQLVVDTLAARGTDAFVEFLETGKFEFKQFLNDVATDLVRATARQLITSAGGALISGLQHGGVARQNEPVIVGERGPELFVPSRTGRVFSNQDTNQALAPSVNVSVVNVDDPEGVNRAIERGSDEVIMNVLQRNADTVRQILR